MKEKGIGKVLEKGEICENERKVLAALAEDYSDDEWHAWYLRDLVTETKLEIAQVRRACRSLAKKGYAKYERGLFNEDGEVAGSGYRATLAGAALMHPCDICGDYISYDYYVDEKGQYSNELYPDEKGHRHVRECKQHYKQSAERATQAALSV